ncbi:ferredoxin-nitrate reductase [Filimonas lacunae]|uniref:nitrate reductase (cytochrome) n=1 Tax=Filimonas lacunae TaxID=477680 RepID=A0A173MGB8_9BACT|nr:nitrate reductase [Filimonas lacunae]BAV06546.1 assimilatory nitrate reductase large subunit [Filimonas lacunae]SIT27341.1 ferredoxin-nitrate reductase [Filimonas lacunae]
MPEMYKTTCCYCGVGCGVIVHQQRDGKIWVEGDKEHPVNKGMLCSKGMNLHYTVMDTTDRLLYPEIRYSKYGPRQRAGWDEALNRVAAVFTAIIQRFGPDAVAFYASGQCLTEEYYVVNKLIKGFIGSNNIDTNSRLCMSSAVAAYKMSLGEDIVPGCYDDIELTDCIFIAGANPAWCHPILWRRIEAAKAANPNLVIIVSDPRVTQTCALATLHLQVTPGTDIVLHHAIGRLLIEQGCIDPVFIRDHTEGIEPYRQAVMQRTLAEAALICGIEEAAITQAAHYIGNTDKLMTMWTMGLNQSAIGVHKNLSLINLHLITGTIGKPGCGPFSLTGQPNAMGGREVGGLSNLLPAHRDLLNAQHREEVQQFWGGTTLSDKPGLTATQMFEALNSGRLKAIWIMGTNPLVSLPDVRMAEAALNKATFVVVQEVSNKPETLAYADVVLPAAAWTEKEGTMTNAERRISYLPQLTQPPGEALPDAEIICRFARKMGYAGFDYPCMEDIYKEHARLTAGTHINISSLSYDVIRRHRTIQWPYNGEMEQPGTRRLFEDHRFYTASGRARIHAFGDENQSEPVSPEYPLILTTGRIRDHWHTMSKTGKVNKLKQHIPSPFLEMHPEDAAERDIEQDAIVEITNRLGNVRVKVKLTESIKKGLVFLPMHWGKLFNNDSSRANNLTHVLLDPVSKQPDFKFSAVQVTRYYKPVQHIIVVGAGAGAHAFARAHRAWNSRDVITVFSKEDQPFYNRVMLPDYVSGTQQWRQLVKMTDTEEKQLNIQLHRGVSIVHVDRAARAVTDSNGKEHSYDVLILATGSSPALLRDTPVMKGIFTMRTRNDADAFKKYVQPGKGKIVIVGGGLLGIEMAASLTEMGMEAILLQRSSKLMDRQLDVLGSRLLQEELADRHIEVLYNDEIERFTGTTRLTGIKLKSGRSLDSQAVLLSIGTVPNIELAKAAGLVCKRGVEVNTYLQTNDEHIYAIGEIAEFKGVLYGITAAAEQQAAVVAAFLNGDISRYYEGSLFMNILKLHGADICSLGMVEPPDDPAYEEVVFIDKARRYYKKCVVYNDRLVGAILIGDRTEFLEFKNLIEQKMELSEKRLQLLRSGKKADPVLGKLICSCGNVGEGNLCQKIKEGHNDLKALCEATGAGMGCGSCRSEVQAIITRECALVTT